jgi:hypothetical protein
MEFVRRGSHVKVVLIDGDELLNLMLGHHIGVRTERRGVGDGRDMRRCVSDAIPPRQQLAVAPCGSRFASVV